MPVLTFLSYYLTILMKQYLFTLLLSAALLGSCSKTSTPTSTNNNNNNNGGGNGGAGTNQVVATVNGTATTFKTLGASGNGSYTNGVIAFSVAALDSATGETIGIGGGGFVSPGNTYDIGTKNLSPVYGFAMSYSKKDANGNTLNYGTNSTTYAKVGTITISTLTSTNAQGTFTATLPQTNGSGSPAVITIGGFNVNF